MFKIGQYVKIIKLGYYRRDFKHNVLFKNKTAIIEAREIQLENGYIKLRLSEMGDGNWKLDISSTSKHHEVMVGFKDGEGNMYYKFFSDIEKQILNINNISNQDIHGDTQDDPC